LKILGAGKWQGFSSHASCHSECVRRSPEPFASSVIAVSRSPERSEGEAKQSHLTQGKLREGEESHIAFPVHRVFLKQRVGLRGL